MRRGSISLLLIALISTFAFTSSRSGFAESSQPYIDSLISELPSDAYSNRPAGQPDPYIRHLKQGVTSEESNGYTAELKKSVGGDGSRGYTDRIQRGLPKETGSAIEDYRKGKKLKANKGDLTTSSAFGFQIAATANRTYTAGENQDVAYDEVYGSGWIPDFKLHFEARPFPKTSFISKFGLYGSAGFNFTKANGVFNYNPNPSSFGSRSRTEFKFIMIPVNAGLIYRMNWGVLWPYFGAGPSAIGFIEQRGDQQPSRRGYSFGYWYMGGVALGLDWLSSDSSWNQYETATIKHSYLAIEYSYLSSISGGLVDMTVDGVQVGFTFEL